MKIRLEYVWLDGYKPEPNLRSKVKVIELTDEEGLKNIPEWGFDGSSTKQAEGYSSDCYLKPVKAYVKSLISEYSTVYVLCDVMDSRGGVHETNDRAKLGQEDEDFWVGFEQEYFIRSGHFPVPLRYELPPRASYRARQSGRCIPPVLPSREGGQSGEGRRRREALFRKSGRDR